MMMCVWMPVWTCLSLEKLTSGLFASFPWNWTLPVNLSHKVVEDLPTNKWTQQWGWILHWICVCREQRATLKCLCSYLVDVDLALRWGLQEGAGVPLASEADTRLFGHHTLHLQVTFVSNQDHGNLQQHKPRSPSYTCSVSRHYSPLVICVSYIFCVLHSEDLLSEVLKVVKGRLSRDGVNQSEALTVLHVQVSHGCELLLQSRVRERDKQKSGRWTNSTK